MRRRDDAAPHQRIERIAPSLVPKGMLDLPAAQFAALPQERDEIGLQIVDRGQWRVRGGEGIDGVGVDGDAGWQKQAQTFGKRRQVFVRHPTRQLDPRRIHNRLRVEERFDGLDVGDA